MSQRIASQNPNSIQCSWCRAFNRADAKSCASCGAPLQTAKAQSRVSFARALPTTTRLRGGDYQIQDVIGQGRFGITYRALNHRLNRVVAIKEWFPSACERNGLQVLAGQHLSADEFNKSKAAFLDEARVLARFDHAALVSVFAAWEENDSAYMEMELLHGPTLAQVLERFHHLKTDDALRLFAPITEALQRLHEENWLHRDLNPHHIVLCNAAFEAKDAATCVQDARAVLIDFGAARQITPDISQEFSLLITPGYTPLEQYARRARRGAYSDIYALCATLYHALSGQIPPPAADRATGSALVPLRDLAPAVPTRVCGAIERGLEIEITRRPQTVRALRELLPLLPVASPVKSAPQVLAAPIAGKENAPQVLAAPLAWPQAADDARVATNAASKAHGGNSLWWLWLVLGPIVLIGVLRPRPRVEPNWSAPPTRLIEEPIFDAPLNRPGAMPYPQFPTMSSSWMQGKIAQAVFSSAGVLAGIENQSEKDTGTIRLWDTESGRVLHSVGTLNAERSAEMVFSPDGKLLAIREGALNQPANVISVDKNSRADEARRTLQKPVQLSVVEVSSGKTLWKRSENETIVGWWSDSSRLSTKSIADGGLNIIDRSGHKKNIMLSPGLGSSIVSSDGRWLASLNEDSIRANATDNGNGWKVTINDGYVNSVGFAPDNSWLMAVGYYGQMTNAGNNAAVDNAVLSSGSGGRAWFFDLKTGKAINVWSGKPEDDNGAGFVTFFSPRGRYVGIRRFSNVLRVWEVRTHRDFAFRWSAPTRMQSQFKTTISDTSNIFEWPLTEFSPNENLILLGGMSRNLWLADLSTRTMRQAQVPLKSPAKSTSDLPVSINASFSDDNQHIFWVDALSGQMGRLSVDDFTQKVKVEIIDGATSRPQ